MSIEAVGSLAELWRYPVKSMLGERVDSSEITEHGLVGDRAWAFLDPETGKLGSAKRHDRWGRLLDFEARFSAPPRAGQPLPAVRITFPDSTERSSDDPAIAGAFAEELGRSVRFASEAPAHPMLEELWPESKGPNHYGPVLGARDGEKIVDVMASFASPGDFFDFSAIHLVTTNSLRELSRREPERDFDVRRFRPNILVDVPGVDGFVENAWDRKVVSVGEQVRLKVIIPTPRCVMTTLAQEGLARDPGILRAAADHNMIRAGGLNEQPCVGVYAGVVAGGLIRVGDPVHVEEDAAPGGR